MSINNIIAEVAAAANMDGQGDNPEAHAALLSGIQRLQLAVEKPTETAKRILYQVRLILRAIILGIRVLSSLSGFHQPPANAALRVAVGLGLIDAVAARWDDPIAAHQLAKQQSTEALLVGMWPYLGWHEQSLSSSLVVRIMRAITAMGICNEVGPSLYLPNQVTREFATAGLGDGVKCL